MHFYFIYYLKFLTKNPQIKYKFVLFLKYLLDLNTLMYHKIWKGVTPF